MAYWRPDIGDGPHNSSSDGSKSLTQDTAFWLWLSPRMLSATTVENAQKCHCLSSDDSHLCTQGPAAQEGPREQQTDTCYTRHNEKEKYTYTQERLQGKIKKCKNQAY